ncbi:MAG: hypothetical protein ACHWZW_21325 [Spirulina sp.]
MGFFDRLREWMRGGEEERRYDNIRVTNMADGTMIEGHDAVKDYFQKEEQLANEHGSSITFQIYRINLRAETSTDLQGPRLTEIKVDGDFVSGEDTVASVKMKIRPLIDNAMADIGLEEQSDRKIRETDQMTFFFNSHPMQDTDLFYADHFMMLPSWVQVCFHDCKSEEFTAILDKFRN